MANPPVQKSTNGKMLPTSFDQLKANSNSYCEENTPGINCFGGTLRTDVHSEPVNEVEGEEVL
jgi:hypothetical protein